METVTNISVFLNKCGGISWFWAPHFCGSLASDAVFVTDLAGIRVLSPKGHQQERVLCVQRNQSFKELVFCLGTMCSLYLSVCPSSPSECREGQICSPGSIAGHARSRAPAAARHLKWSWPTIKTSPLIWEEACMLNKANQSLHFSLPS